MKKRRAWQNPVDPDGRMHTDFDSSVQRTELRLSLALD